MSRKPYDLVVIGGGPGCSTVASLVALRGNRVLLLEKCRFPRHRIGESLLPSTVHGIRRLLGVTEQVGAGGFVRKRGGPSCGGARRFLGPLPFPNCRTLRRDTLIRLNAPRPIESCWI